MSEFDNCPTCGSEETTDLDVGIRGCKCGRNFKPSVERLREQQKIKQKNIITF